MTPEDNNEIGFGQRLGDFVSPSLTRRNAISVLEDERLVNTEQSNHRANEGRIGVAIRNEDPDSLVRHHGLFRRSRVVGGA
jgi:hypothetical protein